MVLKRRQPDLWKKDKTTITIEDKELQELAYQKVLSLLAVLFFITRISTAISYFRLVTEANHILQTLEHNNGSFPKEAFAPSPKLPFESRYFSVQLTDHGSLVAVDTEKIAAIDWDTAIGYAREILATGKHRGFIGNYRYAVQNTPDRTRILFLDCGRSLRNFQDFVATSIAVSCFGMTPVLILIIFFQKSRIFGGRKCREAAAVYHRCWS